LGSAAQGSYLRRSAHGVPSSSSPLVPSHRYGGVSSSSSVSSSSRAVLVKAAEEKPFGGNWLPGSTPPPYLDGTLPGDVGFDPLKLGEDPETLKWYVQAELVHARFAMLASVGILLPEIITKLGLADIPVWFKAGAAPTFASFGTLLTVQLFLMGFAETKRWMDFRSPGSQGSATSAGSLGGFESGLGGTDQVGYPGGYFDPLGYAKNPAMLKEMQAKEIANGRLAMVAMLGFYFQAGVTGKGPVQNWLDHISDPGHQQVAMYKSAVPYM